MKQFRVVFAEVRGGKGYRVTVPELPGITAKGDTLDEARTTIRQLLKAAIGEDPVMVEEVKK